MNQPIEWNRRAIKSMTDARMTVALIAFKFGQTTDLDSPLGLELQSLAQTADEQIQNAIRQTEIAIEQGKGVTKKG